jgi:hypothetical protein
MKGRTKPSLNIQHPTSNIQHPTSNIQPRTVGRARSHPKPWKRRRNAECRMQKGRVKPPNATSKPPQCDPKATRERRQAEEYRRQKGRQRHSRKKERGRRQNAEGLLVEGLRSLGEGPGGTPDVLYRFQRGVGGSFGAGGCGSRESYRHYALRGNCEKCYFQPLRSRESGATDLRR